MYISFKKIFFLSLIGCLRLHAQDPQVSMFYALPGYLSPAFAGSAYTSRIVVNHRQQWPTSEARYSTAFVGFDTYFSKYRLGLGILAMNDNQASGIYFSNGSPSLITSDLTLQASYQFDLNKNFSIRPGIGLGAGNKKLGGDFQFPNQLDIVGPTGGSSNENINSLSIFYPDISSGALLFSNKFWFGVALHHLNRPNISFLSNSNSRLNTKFSTHLGYKIPLGIKSKYRYYLEHDKEYSISPIIHYKRQGTSNQLDIGLTGIVNQFLCGIWYRGLPLLKNTNGAKINTDALVFMIGWEHAGFHVNYAYDATLSKLSSTTNGSHEINISFKFKTKFKQREIPCPSHLRQTHKEVNFQHDNKD